MSTFPQPIPTQRLRSYYKTGKLLQGANRELFTVYCLQHGLCQDITDWPAIQQLPQKRYCKVIEGLLASAPKVELERLRNICLVADNKLLPFTLFLKYIDRYRLRDGTLADLSADASNIDIVIQVAQHQAVLFNSFVATNMYRFASKAGRFDRDDIIPRSEDGGEISAKDQFDRASKNLIPAVKAYLQEIRQQLSKEKPIIEVYEDELVMSLCHGEPIIHEELNEDLQLSYRDALQAQHISIVIRPSQHVVLLIAPTRDMQIGLAKVVAKTVYGKHNLKDEPEHHTVFNLHKMLKDLMEKGKLNMSLPGGLHNVNGEPIEFIGYSLNSIQLVRHPDWFQTIFRKPGGYTEEDHGHSIACELRSKYTRYPQQLGTRPGDQKECYQQVDARELRLDIFMRGPSGHRKHEVTLKRDGSSSLTTESLDETIIATLGDAGYYEGKQKVLPNPGDQVLAIAKQAFSQLVVGGEASLTTADMRTLKTGQIKKLQEQGFVDFRAITEAFCHECGAKVQPDNEGEYECKSCGAVSSANAWHYYADRETMGKALQQAFKGKGDVKIVEGIDDLYSLGTYRIGCPLLLWYGHESPSQAQVLAMQPFGPDAVVLHAMNTPPAFGIAKGIAVFDELALSSQKKLAGKLPAPFLMSRTAVAMGSKGGKVKSALRAFAEPLYIEMWEESHQGRGEKKRIHGAIVQLAWDSPDRHEFSPEQDKSEFEKEIIHKLETAEWRPKARLSASQKLFTEA